MLFVFLTLFFGFVTLFFAIFDKNNPKRKSAITLGISLTVICAVLTFWWNPKDMFTTNESLQTRAEYTAENKKCVDALWSSGEFVGKDSSSWTWKMAVVKTCDDSATKKSGYTGDKKSLFAMFTR
jgi:hypothetical protein